MVPGVLAAECRSTLAFLRAANEPEKLASANVAGSVVGMDARRHARRARGHGHAKDR